MASYTAKQLRGSGFPTEELNGEKTFTFFNPFEGTSYFIFETERNDKGIYDSSSPTNAIGEISNLNDAGGLVQSNYIFGVVLGKGISSFTFTPSSTVVEGTAQLRATGGVSLEIS
jgi:hypothetical protein